MHRIAVEIDRLGGKMKKDYEFLKTKADVIRKLSGGNDR